EAADALEVGLGRHVLDDAGAFHEEPLLLEERRHRSGVERVAGGERAADGVARFVDGEALERPAELAERRFARVRRAAAGDDRLALAAEEADQLREVRYGQVDVDEAPLD